MLEISHLKLVKALAEFGSVSLAANSLCISQSALSHQIKKLEALIDNKVFIRHSDPVRLTFKGKKILDLANDILAKLSAVEQELLQTEGGRLNIAIECHSCFDWLIPTLDEYKNIQPKVDFDLSMAFSFAPMEALKNYSVDMVITSDERGDKEFAYFPIFDYQMLLVMAKNNILATKEYIVPQDLQQQTLLTYPVAHNRLDVFNYFLTPAKVMPERVRTVELPLMITRLILNNQGVATMPQWALNAQQKGDFCLKKLGPSGIWRTLFLAVRDTDKDLQYIQDFIKTAKNVSFKNLIDIRKANPQDAL